jgi:uncharacterized protein
MKVEEISKIYLDLDQQLFEKSYFRHGYLRALYDERALIVELKKVYGEKTILGSPDLKTGLLIITKRLDSNSPWPLGNNPRAKYFSARRAVKQFPTGIILYGK